MNQQQISIEDHQKVLLSIIKKAINNYIKRYNLNGDVVIKKEYPFTESKDFKASLSVTIEYANKVFVIFNKEYTEYITKEDIYTDCLIAIVAESDIRTVEQLEKVN